jgi:hypothetical protein
VDIKTNEQPINTVPTTTEYRSLLASFLVRLCVSVTIGIGLFLAGELYAYWHHAPTGKDAMEPAVSRMFQQARGAELDYLKQFLAADKVMYHPYVLWRRAPFHGSMINVDDDGIRLTTHSDCRDQTFTIWMFGDSAMWGTGSPDDQTIASALAADYERAGSRVCIVNFGEKAWANTQELIELVEQLKHASRKPNAVIFYDGGTESFTAYQTHEADKPSNYRGFKKYLDNWSTEQQPGFSYLRKSNTDRLLNAFATRLPFEPKQKRTQMSDAEVAVLSTAVLQNYQQNMAIVRLLAQEYAFRPMFVWYPNLAVAHKPLTPFEQQAMAEVEQQFPGMLRIYRAAYGRCQQIHDPDLYYLGDIFDDQKGWIFLNISHVKPEANRIVADRLFEIVQHPPQTNRAGSKPSQAVHKRLAGLKPA